MSDKLHTRLLSDKQISEIDKVKFNYGWPENDQDKEPNYFYMAQSLKQDVDDFHIDLEDRIQNRDDEIKVPAHINYIKVEFHDQFDIVTYYSQWYTKFGLEGVRFTNFGRAVLFAVADEEVFKRFLGDLNIFIDHNLNDAENDKYSKLILYVNSFELLITAEILKFKQKNLGDLVIIKLIELPLDLDLRTRVFNSLVEYFVESGIEYLHNEDNETIELKKPTYEHLVTIASHFDIVESITCTASAIVVPSDFNLPKREYGFEISNSQEDLPIIGIVDTGISMETPLAAITLDDTSFTLTGESPLIDTHGDNSEGHGTAVAALASLGKENHSNDFNGEVRADARLLSIKISDNGNGYLSERDLIRTLYDVKSKYPQIRFFVLTTCYNKFKATNEPQSPYTTLLDKFSYDTDSIVFISSGNNDLCIYENSSYDLKYFYSEHTNICTPADSMNNMTVGAAADSLNRAMFLGASDGREYPTLYTRKSHIDLQDLYPRNKSNKNLFKPDVIESGGDIGFLNSTTLFWIDESAMKVMSANPALGYYTTTGSSLSTPLVANLAAKIVQLYPKIENQTIKALIINNASTNNIRFNSQVSSLLNKTAGHGFINQEKILFSNENSITMILEDSIHHDSQRIYPVNFPEYLITEKLGKTNRILKVTATLCFAFDPIHDNQLSYCPIHMAFSFFKNHTSEQINAKAEDYNSKLKTNLNWSQAGRHVSKPIPYSNVQKINFNVNVGELKNERLTFKLAVQARLTSQILKSEFDSYDKEYPFSIVVRIDENLREPKNRLYDEIIAVNEVEALATLDAEGDITLEQSTS